MTSFLVETTDAIHVKSITAWIELSNKRTINDTEKLVEQIMRSMLRREFVWESTYLPTTTEQGEVTEEKLLVPSNCSIALFQCLYNSVKDITSHIGYKYNRVPFHLS